MGFMIFLGILVVVAGSVLIVINMQAFRKVNEVSGTKQQPNEKPSMDNGETAASLLSTSNEKEAEGDQAYRNGLRQGLSEQSKNHEEEAEPGYGDKQYRETLRAMSQNKRND
ncbi:hypothetical protein NC797_16980 [Aquibacillus sp. 3ASR75-11]|uniref:Uncharacterized protein n=1 Tax=Terrihalobacillus insolitus TaxID=2950438 RepID=A0A9X3WWQ7_9BACI|nr:hypothetical protein [Terrihalobacillus insolitus]MDC3413521.1 hypothetical protein [Terrihalobacillus insolitus]MDC3426193.1 hypothetical protein [Terrihalobacillus insolitus]